MSILSMISQQTDDRTISSNDAKAIRTRYRNKLHVKFASNMLQFVPSLPDYKWIFYNIYICIHKSCRLNAGNSIPFSVVFCIAVESDRQ